MSKNKGKDGKDELKQAGAQRARGDDPFDFRALEGDNPLGGDMTLGAAVDLGVTEVHRSRAAIIDAADDGGMDPGDDYVDPDAGAHRYEPRPEWAREARTEPLDRLAKNYLALSIESLRRVPATALSEQFRGRLLTYRHMIGRLVASGRVRGESAILVGVVAALAVDGAGKVDAIVFLRQVMGQVLWSASMDITRLRKPPQDRDERRDAPLGMENMSDHSDTIAGIAGPDTNPTAMLTEIDVYSAVESLHGFLSTVADTLADNEDERLYLRLESGLSYCDERIDDPTMPGGARWEPVYDLDVALDLQLLRNQESLKKRELQRADRRALQLKRLGEMYTA